MMNFLKKDRSVAFLLFFIGACFFLNGSFPKDIHSETGLYLYQAQQMLEGVPPYVSIFNAKFPVGTFFMIPGIIYARFLGLPDVAGVQMFFSLIGAAITFLIYVLSRNLRLSKSDALISGLIFLSMSRHASMFYKCDPKIVAVFFLLSALIAALKRRWFISGICAALIVLSWQPGIVLMISIASGCMISIHKTNRVKSFLSYVAGCVIPALILAGIFAAWGAFSDLITAAIIFPFRYHFDPEYYGYTLSVSTHFIRESDRWDLVLFFFGSLGLILAPILCFFNDRKDDVLVRIFILICFLSLGIWTCFDFQGYHDLYPVFIFISIGIGMWCEVIIPDSRSKSRALIATAVTVLVIYCHLHKNYQWDKPDIRYYRQVSELKSLIEQHAPNGRVLVMGAPEVFAYIRMQNPTKNILIRGKYTKYLEEAYPGGLKQMAEDSKIFDPEIIITGIEDDHRLARSFFLKKSRPVRLKSLKGLKVFVKMIPEKRS